MKLDWKAIATVTRDPLQQLLDKHSGLFEGTLRTIRLLCCVKVNPGAVVPKHYWPRPVPFAIKEAIGSKLEQLRTLENVDHAQWVAPIVPVPGQFWICVDYTSTINDALEVHQHPLPRPDDLSATLTGGEKFIVLDLSQAYLQMKLDNESKKYVTVKHAAR